MIQAKHCDLCEYSKWNLKNGLACGLTGEKPGFQSICSDIKFSDSFKTYIPELLDQIEQLNSSKSSVYLRFCLFGLIGLLLVIGSFPKIIENFIKTFEPDFSYSYFLKFEVQFLLGIIGFSLILMGIRPLKKYHNDLKKLESKRKKINGTLKSYGTDLETIVNLK